MNQSQGGNPFGRLVEFARPHKTGYIISVVLIFSRLQRLVNLSLLCSVCIYQKHSLSRFLLCSGSSLQFPKKRDLLETLCV